MATLFAPGCAITTTRRRRFLWTAWWTAPPCRDPFRKPDAFAGGARTRDEAFAAAERAAGVHLVEIDASWARAWGRILVGRPPWDATRDGERSSTTPGGDRIDAADATRSSIWAILGVQPHAPEDELKRAYRMRALQTHPDHGGTAEAFREVTRAYQEARKRSARPRKRRPQGT
jgi:DnaJ domain